MAGGPSHSFPGPRHHATPSPVHLLGPSFNSPLIHPPAHTLFFLTNTPLGTFLLPRCSSSHQLNPASSQALSQEHTRAGTRPGRRPGHPGPTLRIPDPQECPGSGREGYDPHRDPWSWRGRVVGGGIGWKFSCCRGGRATKSTEAICSSRRVGGKVVRDGDRAHSRLSVWKGVHGRTGRNSYILNVISYTQSKGRAECFHFFFFFF